MNDADAFGKGRPPGLKARLSRGGGVQAPASYTVQFWDGAAWRDAAGQKKAPERPAGGQWNEARFDKVKTTRVRVVFTHQGKARSGVSEVLIWPE